MVSVKSFIRTICSRSWFACVQYRVLFGIIKQVTRHWRCFQFIAAARRHWCYQYEALFVRYVLRRGSYLYGIGLYRVSATSLPVIEDCVQFIAAARRKQCYQFETWFVRSFLVRGSYLHSIGLSQVWSSRSPIIINFCWIHHRSASKTMLSVRSFIHTICSRLWFRFVRYSVLKQVYGKVYGNTIKSTLCRKSHPVFSLG